MRVTLLRADIEELDAAGVTAQEAFMRGLAALGERPTHDRARELGVTDAAIDEAAHLFAETVADMQLIRFAFAAKAPAYHRSRERYEAVDDGLLEFQRGIVPSLRRELRELRAREAELEQELRERGIDPAAIGPQVDEAHSVDPSPKPWEEGLTRRRLPPLGPRKSLLQRLRERLGQ